MYVEGSLETLALIDKSEGSPHANPIDSTLITIRKIGQKVETLGNQVQEYQGLVPLFNVSGL